MNNNWTNNKVYKEIIYFGGSIFIMSVGWLITYTASFISIFFSFLMRNIIGSVVANSTKYFLDLNLEDKKEVKNIKEWWNNYRTFFFVDLLLTFIGWVISISILFYFTPFISYISRIIYGLIAGYLALSRIKTGKD